MIGVVALSVVGGSVFFLTRDTKEPVTPAMRLERALALMDARGGSGSRQKAREIVLELRREEYRDPNFGGAIEFVLGVSEFREAEEQGDRATRDQYLQTVRWLREAEKRTLVAERRDEWSEALGISLSRIGAYEKATVHLRSALNAFPADDVARADSLLDATISTRDPELLERAVVLSVARHEISELDASDRNVFLLHAARALVLLGRTAEADALLATVDETIRDGDEARLFRAQGLLAEEAYDEAVAVLTDVAESNVEGRARREATFLLGRAAEGLGDVDQALLQYERVVALDAESQEAVAAEIRAAELLRRTGRREESLDTYRRVLETVESPADFGNRWISLEEFRATSLQAWSELVDDGDFADAIELASVLGPVFPGVGAAELEARAAARWAEATQLRHDAVRQADRRRLRTETVQRWRDAGRAYAKLAEALRTTTDYGAALLEAAQHFRRGREFDEALDAFDAFLATRPRERLPDALLQRGDVLFELGRFEDAKSQYEEVVERFPTSPVSYEARYAIGRCLRTTNQEDEAAAVWREVVGLEDLSPTAAVWRASLLELARLSQVQAVRELRVARGPRTDDERRRTSRAAATEHLDDAIVRLDEYLERYEVAEHAVEARFLLARSLQQRAGLVRLGVERAETQNVREELVRRSSELLERCIREYRELQQTLLPLEADDRLDEVRLEYLRRSYIEVAQAFYDLGRFDESIVAYGAAANRFPEDARILVCYVQMANAYRRLDRDVEARSMLQQAQLILGRLPDTVFETSATSMSREDWSRWLDWAGRRQASGDEPATSLLAPPPRTSATMPS